MSFLRSGEHCEGQSNNSGPDLVVTRRDSESKLAHKMGELLDRG